jgi:hypothetical protein
MDDAGCRGPFQGSSHDESHGMTPLPPPTTFAEGQRLIYGWLVAGAGVFCGGVSCALIAILVWGKWPETFFGQIITILGCALFAFIAAMCVVIVGLLVGGPVGKFSGKASDGTRSIELDAEGPQP